MSRSQTHRWFASKRHHRTAASQVQKTRLRLRLRARLESLEERSLLSTVNFSAPTGAAAMTFSDQFNSNRPVATPLTISDSGGMMTITDPAETITLLGNAMSHLWHNIDSHTVTGPDSSVASATFNLGNGNDAIDVNTALSAPTTINGGLGNDTVIGPDVNTTWNITGAAAGTLTPNGSQAIAFNLVNNLIGGIANDTFRLTTLGALLPSIDGGAGGHNDTIDASAVANLSINANLAGLGTHHGYEGTITRGAPSATNLIFDDIDGVTGTSGTAVNTLNGPVLSTTWNITDTNKGTVQDNASGNTLDFTAFQNLNGGASDDVFSFRGTGHVQGSLNAGGGSNSLDYSQFSVGVGVNLAGNTASGVVGTVSGISAVTGSPFNDTLVGNSAGTTTFNVSNGSDTVTGGGAGTTTNLVGSSSNNVWTISGTNSGNLAFGGNTTAFSAPGAGAIVNLVAPFLGETNNFVFTGAGSISGNLAGDGSGQDKLDYSGYGSSANVNLGAGTATGVGGAVSSIAQVVGSPYADTISANPFSSTIIWASGGNDNIVGNSASTTLQGLNTTNNWNITGIRSGQLLFGPNVTTFSGVSTLMGGTGDDTFKFGGPGDYVDSVDGGTAGNNDTLDFTSFNAPGNFVSVNVSGVGTSQGFSGSLSGFLGLITPAYNNIVNVVGVQVPSGAYGTTLNSLLSSAQTWNINGQNAGKYTDSASGRSMTFSGVNNLDGGLGDDTFVFADGATITGYLADYVSGNDTLNYSAYSTPVTVNLQASPQTATGVHSLTGPGGAVSTFNKVIGGKANDNLTAANGINTTLQGGAGDDILSGGTGNDTFVWNTGDGHDTINGGGSTPSGNNVAVVTGAAAGGDAFTLANSSGQLNLGDNGSAILTMSSIQSLNVNGGAAGGTSLTIDSSGGNPFPQSNVPGGAGVVFTAGSGPNDSLSLIGGSYTNESYAATGPNSGSISFSGGTGNGLLQFAGLSPVADSTGAANYTIATPGGPESYNLVNSTIGSTPAARLVSGDVPSGFEQVDFANKTNVTINSTGSGSRDVTINNSVQAAGMSKLTLNTGSSDDTVDVVAAPPSVTTAVNTNGGNDHVLVTLSGVPHSAAVSVDGGTGYDQLGVDANGGSQPGSVTATAVTATYADGTHTANYANSEQVQVTNFPNSPPVPGSPVAIATVQGMQLNDVSVATFTDASPEAKASDFVATIDWGDSLTSPSAGVVTQDSANPNVFHVTGTHLFAKAGTFSPTVTIRSTGHNYTTTLGGATVTVSSGASTSASLTDSAVVSNNALAVTVSPVSAVEGVALPSGPIATFSDPGGANPASSYSATISIVDKNGVVVSTVPAAGITQTDSTNSYVVTAPALTFPEAGAYTVKVAVTNSAAPNAVTVTGTAAATVADAPLSASGSQPNLSTVEGTALTNIAVASFTDANPSAPLSDFKATINWGDGQPSSTGTISQPGGPGTSFVVSGTHTYADAGVNGGTGNFSVMVSVTDVEGSTVNLPNTAHVADRPVTVTGNLATLSDTGASNSDGITNYVQPEFVGTSEPYGLVYLYAMPVGGTTPVLVGQGRAQASGAWTIYSSRLGDGKYIVGAIGFDQANTTWTSSVLMSAAHPLVIDTVGPRVTNVQFNRLTGTVTLSFQDNLTGMARSTLLDAANYSFNSMPAGAAGSYIVTGLTQQGGSGGTDPQTVTIKINKGASLPRGYYMFTAKAASVLMASGIRDMAGNPLDGEFYGAGSVSGNGVRGGDFVAKLSGYNNSVVSAATIIGQPYPSAATAATSVQRKSLTS